MKAPLDQQWVCAMAVFLVAFELHKSDRDYGAFRARLSQFTHVEAMDRAVLVESAFNAARIRDELEPLLDAADPLLIVKVADQAAWTHIADSADDWLVRRFRQA